MSISKKKNNKTILILGYGFLAKSLINYFDNKPKYNIFCISKTSNIKEPQHSNVKFINISLNKKINLNEKIDIIINTIGNINHDNFESQDENQIFIDHLYLPKKILHEIKKDFSTLFIQIGSIDEIEQIKRYSFYKTPYALFKNYFSNYLLTLKSNKFLNAKIIYVNSVFGKYQKKDRLIPSAINSLVNKKSFKVNNPKQKRNFISSDEFAYSVNEIICQHHKYKDKIIIKSIYDYKINDIVLSILENKPITKYFSKKSYNSNYDILIVKEKLKMEEKLKNTIKFYTNE